MSILDAVILGLVQGLTEFLPISSSGHLELFTAFLSIKNPNNLLFNVIVHGATAASTMVIFRKDILQLLKTLFQFKWNEHTKFISSLLISAIPIGIVGVLFESQIEQLFGGKVLLVGFMLLITGLLLTFTYYSTNQLSNKITPGKAWIIGVAQALAIMPGISRSGATISTAILLKINKEQATKFSFLMVLIPIIGASALKMISYLKNTPVNSEVNPSILIVGFLTAFISGLLACKWMVNIVRKGKLYYFAIYCFAIGIISIITSAP